MRPIVNSFLRRAAFTLPLLAALAAPAAAQTDSAALVTVLGRDTLALERWVRTPARITAEAVIRSPRTTVRRYVLDLAPDGTMRRFEERVFDPAGSGQAPVRTETLEFAEGGWARTLAQGDSVARTRVEAPAAALPWVDLVHWPFELVLMRAAAGQGGQAPLLSGGRELAYTVAPAEGGGWTLTHPFRGPSVARVDASGRLLSLDAAGTTRKVVVTRVPWVELDAPAARWAQADREGRGMGELSGRGREEATVDGARIVVDYGTPTRRGRDIFPGVVRWGEVWRTGANRATHFATDRALVLGDPASGETIEVPAGEYTLFSIPQEDGGWLIVNRQTGQNGTAYDAARDLGRVRMRRAAAAEPVETFTIRVLPATTGGVLALAWDRSEFTIPFQVR